MAVVAKRAALLTTRRKARIEPGGEDLGVWMSRGILLLNIAAKGKDCSAISKGV